MHARFAHIGPKRFLIRHRCLFPFDAYSRLNLPVAMVYGERSPDYNKEMVATGADVLPKVERIPLSGQGHACHVKDPQQLTEAIETFARRVFEKIPFS